VPQVTLDQVQKNLLADRRWRERRHPHWTSNYELYRDTVITNRLTQRERPAHEGDDPDPPLPGQRTGRPPFEDYGNDGIRELLMNAYWDKVAEENKYELLDVVDKKNVGLYGRSYTKRNILDGLPRLTTHDAFDMLVDRYAFDICETFEDTRRFGGGAA